MPIVEILVERARIVVRLAVSEASHGCEEHVEGLLDTGATRSFISSELVTKLGVVPSGTADVTTLDMASQQRPTYPVQVRVPTPQFATAPAEDHFRARIEAVGSEHHFEGRHSTTPCDVLLGMDLISQWRVEISDGQCIVGW